MSQSETFKSDSYPDGRTKQAFKDETDINKLLARGAMQDALSHIEKHGLTYGEFNNYDSLLDAHEKLQRGTDIFMDLPGEVRQEFHNSPAEFFAYVNDPANKDVLHQKIPQLAQPGTQMPAIRRTATSIESDPVVAANPDPDPAPPAPEPPPE